MTAEVESEYCLIEIDSCTGDVTANEEGFLKSRRNGLLRCFSKIAFSALKRKKFQ
jgi:hypothetical protein